MAFRSMIRWALVAGVACVAAACSQPKQTPGPDSASGSNAQIEQWSDGKPAIAIACSRPGGCQQRAQAMCPNGYTTLKSENMPVSGGVAKSMTSAAAQATVRCN